LRYLDFKVQFWGNFHCSKGLSTFYTESDRKGRGFPTAAFKMLRAWSTLLGQVLYAQSSVIDNPPCCCYQYICLLLCQLVAVLQPFNIVDKTGQLTNSRFLLSAGYVY